jgi:hypothetical protein
MTKPPAVQVQVRMSGALKAAMDKAAAQNQTSISGEVSHRLKRTLLEDEQRGGNDLQRVQARLNEALRHGGELGADASGVAREKWLTDPVARRVARAAWLKEWDAIEALLSEQPK